MIVLLGGDDRVRWYRVDQQLRQQHGEVGATTFRQLPKALFASVEHLLLPRQLAFLIHEVLLAINFEDRDGFTNKIAQTNHKSNGVKNFIRHLTNRAPREADASATTRAPNNGLLERQRNVDNTLRRSSTKERKDNLHPKAGRYKKNHLLDELG
jgi:hypothetical protein